MQHMYQVWVSFIARLPDWNSLPLASRSLLIWFAFGMKWSFQTPSLNHFRPAANWVGDLGGLAVGGDDGAGAEEGRLGQRAVVGPLHVEAPLDDVRRRRSSALVASLPFLSTVSFMPSVADGVHVPRLAVVQVADLGRRVAAAWPRRTASCCSRASTGRSRTARRSWRRPRPCLKKSTSAGSYLLMSKPVDVDERREVEQLVAEDVQAFDADRTDDVRRVAGGDLRLEHGSLRRCCRRSRARGRPVLLASR